MQDFMNTESQKFFEVVLDRTSEVVVVVQAEDSMQAWCRALLVQDQLDPAHTFTVGAVNVRPASLPFKAPTFSSGYFSVLDELRAANNLR